MPVESLLFQSVDRGNYLTFELEDSQPPDYLFLGNSVFEVYESLMWYEPLIVQIVILSICGLLFLLALIMLPFQQHFQLRRSALLVGAIALLNLIFLISMGFMLRRTYFWDFFYSLSRPIQILLYLPPLSIGLLFLLVVCLSQAWWHRQGQSSSRIFYSTIAITALIFFLDLNYWNLLGFQIY